MKILLRLLRWLMAVIGLGLAGLMAVGTYPVWSGLLADTPATFSVESWREAHRLHRTLMAQDLLTRQTLVGMQRADVLALLGTPDSQTPTRLDYVVAITAADYLLLGIEFDQRDAVSKAYLRQS